jgi:hypothetical protein
MHSNRSSARRWEIRPGIDRFFCAAYTSGASLETGKSALRRVFGWEAESDGAILRQVSHMKSEHRHELAENDLSKAINRLLEKAEPHSNKILLAALVVTVVVVAVVYGVKSTSGSRSAGFAELTGCETGDCFENVADEYPETAVGVWARLRAAEMYLADGIQTSTTNRNVSSDSLHKAKEAFDQVLKGDNIPPQARERALYGMGTCLETLSDQNTSPAIDAYQSLLDEFKDSQYKYLVEDRIKALKTSQAQEFYAWFHKQNPKPEDRPGPRDPLDFLKHTTPQAADDNGSGLPPPPPSAEPQTPAPTPPGDSATESGPSLPQEPPPAGATSTPEPTPGTPPEGAAPGGEKPETPAPEAEGAAAPAPGAQP